ncbi:hypothetical protein HMPREF0604_00392 [Neisseria mucosa C102]|uniref:Uncharacterized protein n=1 Tax=Neisseria mucosa C102 TaxID=435832 RepID=A0ABP2KIE1_NEIMU|nr:hypothetical protein HMPREF0604_00392 [Neisseria mucosa C102]
MAEFQHTAARRRLVDLMISRDEFHSFNTQPPEGGWALFMPALVAYRMFQHTAA